MDNTLERPRDVAKRFDVTTATVRRWLREGKAPGQKTPGGEWRFGQLETRRGNRPDDAAPAA